MAKEELIQFEGLVTEILPDARYRVQLDAGHEIVAYTAGKMKKNRIKTLAGHLLEAAPQDIVLRAGGAEIAGTDRRLSLAELALRARDSATPDERRHTSQATSVAAPIAMCALKIVAT